MKQIAVPVFLALVATACGGTASPAASPSPKPLVFQVQQENASGVGGTVEVLKASASFTLTWKLKGLAPNSGHISHIHKGHCPNQPGTVAYALTVVQADGSGNSVGSATVQTDYVVPDTGWYANAHAGPDLQGGNAKSIACAELANR